MIKSKREKRNVKRINDEDEETRRQRHSQNQKKIRRVLKQNSDYEKKTKKFNELIRQAVEGIIHTHTNEAIEPHVKTWQQQTSSCEY